MTPNPLGLGLLNKVKRAVGGKPKKRRTSRKNAKKSSHRKKRKR